GRDALLGGSGLAMATLVLNGERGGLLPNQLGLIALVTSIAVAVHAIVHAGSSRHVYYVEVLIVALYAFATRTMNLRPEVDAILGLFYGFTLLGVATIARRRGLDRVATATRRFLALLPVLVALFTMRGPTTNTTAMLAFGSSVLYAVVAFS